jgi:acetolactate synthase small subunit
MFRSLYLSRPWSSCFEGEEEAAKAATEKAATDKAAAEAAAAAGKATFTQDDLNRILAEDRRKHQAQIKEQAEKLEGVLKSSQLTEQDRKVLQENLVSLQGQLRSSEAAAAKEKQELEQAFQAKLVESEKKTQIWEGLYRESTVQRALQDAAVKNDAWQPSQIVTLLKPMTKLVEGVDPVTNRPNGNYEVKVVMLDVNPKTGQQEEMTRTPQDAVARMKELPETYGNLFKSGVVSGIGSSSATGGLMPGKGGQIDVRKLTPAQYREIRAKNPELLGLAPKRR